MGAVRQAGAVAGRRTQDERSASTRERLLDATIASLIDVGYARTTTTLVCERAGLSRGAQVHHFPKKEALVLEAVAYLARRSEAALVAQARELPQGSERLVLLVDGIVELFTMPDFYAVLELWVAARTDTGLHEPMVRFEKAVGKRLLELWREFGGEAACDPDFTALVELSMLIAQGLSLQKILRADDVRSNRLVSRWKAMVTQALAQPLPSRLPPTASSRRATGGMDGH
jgi:AcrR family transcriptional regulator